MTLKKTATIILAVALSSAASAQTKTPRTKSARTAFQRSYACPSTGKSSGACPGYVVDHIQPLACGGDDLASNMQWQTIADAKKKDAIERKGCDPANWAAWLKNRPASSDHEQ